MLPHALDIPLQRACPTVMVPLRGEFIPLGKSGHRFLSASDGLWVEVRRPWLHLIWPVALQENYPMPYGKLERKIDLAFRKIPVDLVARFYRDAIAASPRECGAWLVWDDRSRVLKYRPMQAISAGVGHLEAQRPDLEEHESLAVNLHSHGPIPAHFSPTDNRDDRNEVKIAGVIGSLDEDRPTVAFRICTGGEFIDLDVEKLLPSLGA